MTKSPRKRTQTNPKRTQIQTAHFPNGRYQKPGSHPNPSAKKNEKTNPNSNLPLPNPTPNVQLQLQLHTSYFLLLTSAF